MRCSLRCWLVGAVIGCLVSPIVDGASGKNDPKAKDAQETESASAACDVNLSPTSAEVDRAVAAITDLGFSLYRQLAAALPATSNILISPTSIAMTLASLALGAEGETRGELLSALGLSRECDHRILKFIFGTLPAETSRVASHVFLRGIQINPAFGEKLYRFYNTRSTVLDGVDLEGDLHRMNAWVSSHTEHRIKNLVSELGRDSQLVLLNALYYKGAWVTAFDPANTVSRQFVMPGGQTKTVPMVYAENYPFRLSSNPASPYEFAEFPFRNGSSLVAVSPRDRSDAAFRSMEQQLRSVTVRAAHAHMKDAAMSVAIPKLTLDTKMELTEALHNMAPHPLRHTLSPSPELSLAGGSPTPALRVSAAVHAAYLRLDEIGVEAAAGTALGAARALRETALDRPFAFILRDGPSGGLPLLMGRVVDPDPDANVDPED